MKRDILLVLLVIVLVFTFVPVTAAAASSTAPVEFDVMAKYKGDVYAISILCAKDWKRVKNAELFCVSGSYIYYIDQSTGGTLYRCKLNGTGRKLLSKYCDWSAYLKDNKIYFVGFVNASSKTPVIYCYDLKTSKKTKLVSNGYIRSCDENYIYYRQGDGGIYRCDYSGKGKKKLIDPSEKDYGIVYKDYYYCAPWEDGIIYRTDFKKPVSFDQVTETDIDEISFIIDNDLIYYIYNHSVYRCKLDGSDAKKLCALNSKTYGASPCKVIDKTLYFVEQYSSGNYNMFLYKVSVNGGKKTYMNKKWCAD